MLEFVMVRRDGHGGSHFHNGGYYRAFIDPEQDGKAWAYDAFHELVPVVVRFDDSSMMEDGDAYGQGYFTPFPGTNREGYRMTHRNHDWLHYAPPWWRISKLWVPLRGPRAGMVLNKGLTKTLVFYDGGYEVRTLSSSVTVAEGQFDDFRDALYSAERYLGYYWLWIADMSHNNEIVHEAMTA